MSARPQEPVGLVLAGGGARGAYEIGALSELLPALEERGERPSVLVGTSVGALNTGYLAATADRPVGEVSAEGERIWRETTFRDVLAPVISLRALGRSVRFGAQLLSARGPSLPSLLDPAPLGATLERLIPFERISANVASGALVAAAVVTTSAASSRTVVFHEGGAPSPADSTRGIDYVPARLAEPHVRASAAIPALFPAVHLEEPGAAGWYFDGGTRLNTPIKPALALGARRVIVIALDSLAPAPPAIADERRPDAVEGAAQFLQAVLVDPLVNDVRTLAGINEQVMSAGEGSGRSVVPYILIAPQARETIGELAMEVFRRHYSRLRDLLRSRDLALLGRAVAGGADAVHGELMSLLFFAPEFADALLELGRDDARRWLAQPHHEGPWEVGRPA